ncbi:hypothetical protein BJ982_001496 [Sphaerisporangium siamense]|uniref:Uncharacterized protein n=1 Tax=Sphaerisporangium siamense TaxID=795645 RepID=A0A7W7G872_9ACTN|nr:hypothetical protein [Sphaerisporangium siamense]
MSKTSHGRHGFGKIWSGYSHGEDRHDDFACASARATAATTTGASTATSSKRSDTPACQEPADSERTTSAVQRRHGHRNI